MKGSGDTSVDSQCTEITENHREFLIMIMIVFRVEAEKSVHPS